MIPTKSLFAIRFVKKTDASWRMMAYYHKLNQMVVQITVAVPDVASFLERISIFPNHLELTIDLVSASPSIPVSKTVRVDYFQLAGLAM